MSALGDQGGDSGTSREAAISASQTDGGEGRYGGNFQGDADRPMLLHFRRPMGGNLSLSATSPQDVLPALFRCLQGLRDGDQFARLAPSQQDLTRKRCQGYRVSGRRSPMYCHPAQSRAARIAWKVRAWWLILDSSISQRASGRPWESLTLGGRSACCERASFATRPGRRPTQENRPETRRGGSGLNPSSPAEARLRSPARRASRASD